MTTPSIHNKQINKAARQILRPMGLIQKGQSRCWYDDRNWWIGHVEFQPSGWGKGSYLNAAACWIWHRRNYASFDSGPVRVEGFIQFTSEEQFEAAALHLAERAAEEILKLRTQFTTLQDVAEYLESNEVATIWSSFNAGIAWALLGDRSRASRFLSSAIAYGVNSNLDWEINAGKDAEHILRLCDEPLLLRQEICDRIQFFRKANKLPDLDALTIC